MEDDFKKAVGASPVKEALEELDFLKIEGKISFDFRKRSTEKPRVLGITAMSEDGERRTYGMVPKGDPREVL